MYTNTVTNTTGPSRLFLSIGRLVLQVLLAAVFLARGFMFLAPPAELQTIMNAQLNPAFRLFLSVAEVPAAFGLIFPGVTRILPFPGVWAAVG